MPQVDAIFDNGVFRPLNAVTIPDQRTVRLTFVEESPASLDPVPDGPVEYKLSMDKWDEFLKVLDGPAKTVPAMRKLLRTPGVGDDDTIAH